MWTQKLFHPVNKFVSCFKYSFFKWCLINSTQINFILYNFLYQNITLLTSVFYWQMNSNFCALQSLTDIVLYWIIFSHTSSKCYNHKNSAKHVISGAGTRQEISLCISLFKLPNSLVCVSTNLNKYEISTTAFVLSLQRLQLQCFGNFLVQFT
jgi:hypothetical protein